MRLNDSLKGLEERTKAVAVVLVELRDRGVITGWRDELFPVVQTFSSDPVLLIERAAASAFGIKAYGVHVNGYVQRPDGSKAMWVARRSKTKQTWPGMLDHIVAGGGLGSQEGACDLCSKSETCGEGGGR